jgi:hypothetical protein
MINSSQEVTSPENLATPDLAFDFSDCTFSVGFAEDTNETLA